MLRLFVKPGYFEGHEAQAMLEWPHSGFHVHDEVLVPEDDTAFALRLARYCARNPVALERLEYDAKASRVKYRSDKTEGPTAGSETLDPLEFLARLVTHIPRTSIVRHSSRDVAHVPWSRHHRCCTAKLFPAAPVRP